MIHAGINFPRSWNNRNMEQLYAILYPNLSYSMTYRRFEILVYSEILVNHSMGVGKSFMPERSTRLRGLHPYGGATPVVLFQLRTICKLQIERSWKRCKCLFSSWWFPVSESSRNGLYGVCNTHLVHVVWNCHQKMGRKGSCLLHVWLQNPRTRQIELIRILTQYAG